MKIEVNSCRLRAVTSRLIKVIDLKSPLQITHDFLLERKGGVFSITAMNANTTAKEILPAVCDFDSDLSLAIDSSVLSGFVDKIAGDDKESNDLSIVVSKDRKKVTIKYDSGKIAIPCQETDMFPIVSTPGDRGIRFGLNGKLLSKMMYYVSQSVQEDELRPVLGNILINIKDGKMKVVSSNYAEIRYCCADVDVDPSLDVSVLINPKFYDIIYWYISKIDNVQVVYEDKKTFFKVGPAYLYQVNPEGKYIDYARVISRCVPDNCTQSFIVDRKDFLKHIDRVEIVSKNIFTIKIDEEESYLVNEVGDQDINVKEEFSYNHVDGHNGFDLSFNIKKFKNALKNLESSSIEVKKCDLIKCAYFEETDSMGIYKLFLLMSFVTNR